MSGRSIDVNYYGVQQGHISTAAFFAPQFSTSIQSGAQMLPATVSLTTAECGCGARAWDYDAKERIRCGSCHCQPREATR